MAAPPREPNGRSSLSRSSCVSIRGSVIQLDAGAGRISEREPADLPRREQVPLHQRRRDRQHLGDVVEAVLVGVVGRQQRPRVDVEREQIADGVRVFGAVQAMERRPAGIRAGRGRAIESGLRARTTNAAAAGFSGRGRPTGGIVPARSFRTTFSQTSALLRRRSSRRRCRARGPPVFSRWLWQVTQYGRAARAATRSPVRPGRHRAALLRRLDRGSRGSSRPRNVHGRHDRRHPSGGAQREHGSSPSSPRVAAIVAAAPTRMLVSGRVSGSVNT